MSCSKKPVVAAGAEEEDKAAQRTISGVPQDTGGEHVKLTIMFGELRALLETEETRRERAVAAMVAKRAAASLVAAFAAGRRPRPREAEPMVSSKSFANLTTRLFRNSSIYSIEIYRFIQPRNVTTGLFFYSSG
jgi:hypothetical protein